MNHRVLGALGMLGAPMMFVEGLRRSGGAPDGDLAFALIELLYLGGWACSVLGLRRLRATGDSPFGKTVVAVQIVGLCLAAIFTILEALGPKTGGPLLRGITDMAWPLSHLFMLAVGVATLRAGVWRTWRRFTPLLCGLVLPSSVLFGAAGEIVGKQAFEVITMVAFLTLGYAVFSGGPENVRERNGKV